VSKDTSSWYVSDLSVEYVKVRVQATVNGVTPYDPTADQVQFAFVDREAEPAGGDWVNGTWETQTINTPNGVQHIYRALGLVGPGAKVLARGVYDVYVKIFDNPETPVRFVGILEVGA
jgi:hypothetical protein